MAVNPGDIKAQYPLPVYNYRVEIEGESIAFSEVSGLSIGFETSTYKESKTTEPGAGPKVLYMPAQLSQLTITLKKGYVFKRSMAVLYNWINSIQLNQVQKKDIRVRLCDEEGNPVVTWTIIDAFPTKLDAPTFDANSNDVAIETMTLVASRLLMEEN